MKKLLIIQPGKLGDIILMMPIAKYYYDLGYNIDYPVFSNFYKFFDKIDYVNAINFDIPLSPKDYYSNSRLSMFNTNVTLLSMELFSKIYDLKENNEYDLILDPCWSFPGHVMSQEKIFSFNEAKKNNKKWITLKYEICNVPIKEKNKFLWTRDEEKEEKLLNFIKEFSKKKYGSEKYSIVHAYESDTLPKFEVKNPINFSFIKGYEIYDWIKVLENSQNIVCIDSCLSHFVESQESLKNINKFYIGSEENHWNPFMFNILKNNWTNLTNSDIESL